MVRRLTIALLVGLPVMALVAASVKAVPLARSWWDSRHKPTTVQNIVPDQPQPRASLVPKAPETLELPVDVVKALGVKTAKVIAAPPPEPLKLDGSLFLDANRMVHIHTRFAGEVVELGELDSSPPAPGESAGEDVRPTRTIRFGDAVKKGQLLAVIWSKELGEKKSELVENLSRLRLDQEQAKRLEGLMVKGAVPERNVREAERLVEADLIAVTRVERTLRSWRLTESEIDLIRQEAEKVHKQKGQWGKELESTWARVEVRAPISATIMEKNVAVGDFVTTDFGMFTIADLTRLDVLAHVYEEDLPEVEKLPYDQRRWTIHLRTDPDARPVEGSFERIGTIIDPNQHTALTMGWVDNSSGRLRVGQFVTANINLPAGPNEVAVPNSAVIDEEGKSLVFVQTDPNKLQYTCRHVLVVRRRDDFAYVSSQPPPGQRDNLIKPLTAGELVVTVGGVELAAELESLQAAEQSAATSTSKVASSDAPQPVASISDHK